MEYQMVGQEMLIAAAAFWFVVTFVANRTPLLKTIRYSRRGGGGILISILVGAIRSVFDVTIFFSLEGSSSVSGVRWPERCARV
jgi:hypothetical protein